MNVFLVGTPHVNWAEWSRFVAVEKLLPGNSYVTELSADGEALVEMCGRLCYMSYGKGRKTTAQFLDNIIKSQHFSVLEHANWTFIITGVSRSLTHELVRHRHLSFSQLSQRYVDHTETPAVHPAELNKSSVLGYEWFQHQERGRALYAALVAAAEGADGPTNSRKTIRGMARSVLSEATETKIAVTGNARAWREFIQKRMNPQADQEIRALARMILERLWQSAPDLFRDLMPGTT